jgi:hypothetical protein
MADQQLVLSVAFERTALQGIGAHVACSLLAAEKEAADAAYKQAEEEENNKKQQQEATQGTDADSTEGHATEEEQQEHEGSAASTDAAEKVSGACLLCGTRSASPLRCMNSHLNRCQVFQHAIALVLGCWLSYTAPPCSPECLLSCCATGV